MAFHDNTAHARRNIGTESAGSPSPITKRNAAGEYATTIGDHQFSRLICARVPCARNGGKIEAGFHSWRSLSPPACPPNGFHSEESERELGTGSLQGTLRPAQQEAGAGLAQGKLVRWTAQRSPSADRDSGDSEPESLACLSSGWRLQEISVTGAWIQSCASCSCGWAGVYHCLVMWPVYTSRNVRRCASPGT